MSYIDPSRGPDDEIAEEVQRLQEVVIRLTRKIQAQAHTIATQGHTLDAIRTLQAHWDVGRGVVNGPEDAAGDLQTVLDGGWPVELPGGGE